MLAIPQKQNGPARTPQLGSAEAAAGSWCDRFFLLPEAAQVTSVGAGTEDALCLLSVLLLLKPIRVMQRTEQLLHSNAKWMKVASCDLNK